MPYRADLQRLRGVAVLLVVAYHAWPSALPGGFVGVDVFFVISGYLITGLLVAEFRATGRVDLVAFYARRARRLVPAASVMIATVVLVSAWRLPAFEVADVASAALAASAYASNLWFAYQSLDYLAPAPHRQLLLHTWSLGVEEQFYLVWPLVLVVSARVLGGGRVAAATWAIALLGALSLCACIVLTPWQSSVAFFTLPTRLWELGVGAWVHLWFADRGPLPAGRSRAIVWTGFAVIAGSAASAATGIRYPGISALLPVTGAALVILAGSAAEGQSRSTRAGAALERLGDISYPLYLWHWPILILVADSWPASAPPTLAPAVGLAASAAAAVASHAWLESPIRRWPGAFARPRRTLSASLAVLGATATLAAAVSWQAARDPSGASLRASAQRAATDTPRLYRDRCFAAALDTDPGDCVYGPTSAVRTVALVGDSHAAQWFPTLEALARRQGFRLAVFVKAACPLAAVEPFDPKLGRSYVECTRWRDQVFERLARLRPQLVVAAHSSFYAPFAANDASAMLDWQRGLGRSLDRLGTIAGHVVVMADTPWPGFHVPRCLAQQRADAETAGPACSFDTDHVVTGRAARTDRAAIGERAGVSFLDLTSAICPGSRCLPLRDGIVLYHDAQHLSASFARSLAAQWWLRLPGAARDALQP